jgi:hypothetical protein
MNQKEGRTYAKENGINDRTYRYRIAKGYTVEQACTFPPYTRFKQTKPKEEVIAYRTKQKEWRN